MIAPPIPSRALDGPHIARLFDHTQERRIAPRVATDRAGIVVRQVAARPAGYDLAPNPPDGLRQPLRGSRQTGRGPPPARFPPAPQPTTLPRPRRMASANRSAVSAGCFSKWNV